MTDSRKFPAHIPFKKFGWGRLFHFIESPGGRFDGQSFQISKDASHFTTIRYAQKTCTRDEHRVMINPPTDDGCFLSSATQRPKLLPIQFLTSVNSERLVNGARDYTKSFKRAPIENRCRQLFDEIIANLR